ncbi:hypothetical protein EX928_23595, partial [Salmonella enterica subsp. enterica serovar Virchow]|nr:hypothetical protein [Salmonella enterica subsp. enterica serovar Virchow]
MTDFGGKTCIFSHPVYLFLREFSLQDSQGGSLFAGRIIYLLITIFSLIKCVFIVYVFLTFYS